jgi:pimeloyl-ACP methyl ester carboxylesterase
MKISSNGVQLNVNDTKKGDTALVFQHFWGGSSLTWDDVISKLQDRFRCVAIDARGAGSSDAPDIGYSMEDHAGDALNVIKSLELSRYVLVGHSMGGKSAQLLASNHPQGLLGLALVASSPLSPMPINQAMREQMKVAYLSHEAVEWSLDNVLLGSSVSAAARSRLIADALRLSSAATEGWIDVGAQEDFSKEAPRVEVPVVIVAGELDRVDPVAVVKAHVASHYPSAKVHFLPNKGHLLPVEAPSEIATIISDFAQSL